MWPPFFFGVIPTYGVPTVHHDKTATCCTYAHGQQRSTLSSPTVCGSCLHGYLQSRERCLTRVLHIYFVIYVYIYFHVVSIVSWSTHLNIVVCTCISIYNNHEKSSYSPFISQVWIMYTRTHNFSGFYEKFLCPYLFCCRVWCELSCNQNWFSFKALFISLSLVLQH